jgi:uncharacterized protein YydD (DUF2326 family)
MKQITLTEDAFKVMVKNIFLGAQDSIITVQKQVCERTAEAFSEQYTKMIIESNTPQEEVKEEEAPVT